MMIKNSEKGVSLIITFFILTIILAVVLSISIILYREIKIIRSIGNSVVSFYAADSGIEKTLYFDRKKKPIGVKSGVCAMCDPENPTCPSDYPIDQSVACHCDYPSGADCDPQSCESCDISFYTNLNSDKDYYVKVNVSTDGGISNLSINSMGDFKNTKRAVQVLSTKEEEEEEEAGSSNWLDGWSHRKRIIIENDYIDADLIDFPLYVKVLGDSDMAEAIDNGNDIRFTDSDGNILNYERESWGGGGGSAVQADFWVKIPVLRSASPTIIYIYYGNAGAPDGQDVENTWDGDYIGVWHLKERGDGTANEYIDSTSTNNNGQGGGGIPGKTPKQVNGVVYKGQILNGNNDYIGMSSNYASTNNNFMISMWANPSATRSVTTESNSGISGTGSQRYAIFPDWYTSESGATGIGVSVGTNGVSVFEHAAYHLPSPLVYNATISGWTYIVVDYNNKQPKLYLNSSFVRTGITSGKTYVHPSASINADIWYGPYKGSIDELRISSINRPAEWIKFEYHNMFETDSELIWGDEE